MAKLKAADIAAVKAQGFLLNRGTELFSGRIVAPGTVFSAEDFKNMGELAARFGNGKLICTSRLAVEIPGIPFEKIPEARQFAADHGMRFGGTGGKVRPVTACKGTTCVYGNYDTQELARKIHEDYYLGWDQVKLPHKFKIAVGGCPNNCVKPDLNDLGVVGQRVPMIDYAKCRGCKVCQVEKNCPIKVAHMEDGKIHIDPNACNNCGRCKGKCPFGALEEYQEGYKILIGGRWGKKVAHGIPLTRIFTSEDEVMDVIEKAILLFRDEGISGERFADTVARLGFDYVNEKLLGDSIDKEAVLKKTVKGGATC